MAQQSMPENLRQEFTVDSIFLHYADLAGENKLFENLVKKEGGIPVERSRDGKDQKKHLGEFQAGDVVTISLDEGAPKHYKLVHHVIEPETGFKATCFVEVDGGGKVVRDSKTNQPNVRFYFPGNTFTRGDMRSVVTSQRGDLLEQITQVQPFLDASIERLEKLGVKPEEKSAFTVGAHSLGAGLSLFAKVLLQAQGYNVQGRIIEPFGMAVTLRHLAEAMQEVRGEPLKKIASEIMEDVITLQMWPLTAVTEGGGDFPVGETYRLNTGEPQPRGSIAELKYGFRAHPVAA
jgi:hypothetical protein